MHSINDVTCELRGGARLLRHASMEGGLKLTENREENKTKLQNALNDRKLK